MLAGYERRRILIWGKTYPEISKTYFETVCTGGVLEDGWPVRLYPIPFRFLEGSKRFKKYDVIEVDIKKSTRDTRLESYKIDPASIEVIRSIPATPADGWAARREILFQDPTWQYSKYEDLYNATFERRSIGVIKPKQIIGINVKDRETKAKHTFKSKVRIAKAKAGQESLFVAKLSGKFKELEYVDSRLRIEWQCSSSFCGASDGHRIHRMQVLDWEVIEMQRKFGLAKAHQMLDAKLQLGTYDLRFFLGNFHTHPNRFAIVGLWYPKLSSDLDFFR